MKPATPAYSLKVGTEEDRETIKGLCKTFFENSIYSNLKCEDTKIDELTDQLLHNPSDGIVLLGVPEDEPKQPIGILAAITSPLLFNYDRIASELVWWVDKEHRGSNLGKDLIDAFEYWAKEIAKAEHAQLTSLSSDDLGPYYEKRGYKFIEKAYLKTWQQ